MQIQRDANYSDSDWKKIARLRMYIWIFMYMCMYMYTWMSAYLDECVYVSIYANPKGYQLLGFRLEENSQVIILMFHGLTRTVKRLVHQMFIYAYVYMYIYKYIYIHIANYSDSDWKKIARLNMFICICLHMGEYMYICLDGYMHVFITYNGCIYIHVFMQIQRDTNYLDSDWKRIAR
jgi:hypothetical protein